jgi:endonuclease/exonuclease/phosphatase (EEP) superfamily protein YafD
MKFVSVTAVLQVIAVLSTTFFALGLFGRQHWTLDLFSHFAAQYAAALLTCAAGFFLLKRKKSAAASLLAGLGIVATMLLSWRPLPPPAGPARLKLASYNVNTSNVRHQDVFEYLTREDPDVLFLMEVNDEWMQTLRPLASRYPHRLIAPRDDNFGLALYSKTPFQGETKEFGVYGIPWTDITLTESAIRIIAVHPLPPSSEENSRLRNEQLFAVANVVRGKPRTIVCGDLNLTPYSRWFPELLRQSGLRSTAPPFSPTWSRHYPLFAIPIDHVLLSWDLTLARRRIGPSLSSDHNALIVEVADTTPPAP